MKLGVRRSFTALLMKLVCVCLFVPACARFLFACLFVSVCLCISQVVRLCLSFIEPLCSFVCVCICVHVHVYMYVSICMCLCMCVRICVCARVCPYVAYVS